MGKLISSRLKANSLIETIVAMVIITTIFGIATTLYVKILSYSAGMQRLKAEGILKAYSEKVRQERDFYDSDEKVENFDIKKSVVKMSGLGKLWQIHYYIYDNEKKLLVEWQQYVSII